jgi:dienelactone hydrolase
MALMTRAGLVTVAALAAACSQPLKLMKDDSAEVLSRQTIAAPNPADKGSFAVKTLFYGSGTDLRRPEYRDQVAIKTRTVDVSPFASVPAPQAKERKKFFGFDLKKAPINGRVWYPDGAGPYPLVLIVHGNHTYREFSDPGYGYLGELLASRGFIMASVDENFINGGISGENDARAWILLKHFEAWKKFNDTEGGPFFHRVDMTRLAVMGHSRGGEAAATAAAFNKLKYYPDDFKQEFNFNFAIKGVVAIAPVDGQYKPTGQFTPLENVNYLLIHGSHDGDVSTAVGLRQYDRLKFTDGEPRFKSVFFMYRANHGQWNTVWANKDGGPRSGRVLDLRALIDPEAQRQFAKVVISGFLEATLHDRREYLPMYRDHRTAGAWLPKTMYTTSFQESGYRPLAEFDNDVDLTTGSGRGVVIAAENLSTWNENAMPFRGRGGDTQNHNAVWIGWNNRLAGSDKPAAGEKPGEKPGATEKPPQPPKPAASTQKPKPGEKPEEKLKLGPPASYAISVPDALRSEWGIGDQSVVYLSLAVTNTKPGPRAPKKDPKKEEEAEQEKEKTKDKPAAKKEPPKPKPPPAPKEPKKKKEEPDLTPVDFTVELVDTAGHVARLPISRFGIARHPMDSRIYRREGRDTQRFTNIYELVAQTFVMPVADFAGSSSEFDPRQLATIRLLFDKTEAGTVILERVGISTPKDRAFLAAPIGSR